MIAFLIQLHLCPSHKLRTSHAAQLVESRHGRSYLLAHLRAKLSAEPGAIMVRHGSRRHGIDVPCHIQKELQIVACHLQVMHIDNPHLPDMVVVSLAHLVVYQTGLRRRQPQIVMRTSPVAQMVIDTCPALSLLLSSIGEASHIAVVVITPHQRHIVRDAQSLLIQLKHLLVGHKHLSQS